MSLRETILDDLREIPVTDAHAHVIGHKQCVPVDSVMDLLMDPYIGVVMMFASRAAAAAISDPARSDRERWEVFVDVWPSWRATGYGRVLAGTLMEWGLDAERLSSGMYPALLERAQGRSPEVSRAAYVKAGIESSLTHFLGMPHLGGPDTIREFIEGDLVMEDGFFPELGAPPLHEYPNREELNRVGSVADIEVTDLDTLVAAVHEVIRKCVGRGIVGFKEHRAYSLGTLYAPPDRDAAQRDVKALLAGEVGRSSPRALSDYLFDQIVQAAVEHSLPIAVHTGYRQLNIDNDANVVNMRRIFDSYPEATFDIYHLNYPYAEDHLAAIKSYPNLYANTCWAHIIDPAYTIDFLKTAIGAIPANHVFGFGSDFAVLPEATVAHLEIARNNIAEALAWAVGRRMISRSSALELARMWLHTNARDVYRLEERRERMRLESH